MPNDIDNKKVAFTQLKRAAYGLGILLTICFLSLPSLRHLHLSNDFRVYFSADNPQLQSFEHFEENFSSHDSIFLIARLKNESWLTFNNMKLLEQFTEQFWELPATTRVNSLSNHQYTYSNSDTLYTVNLSDYSNDPKLLRQALLSDPQLNKTFLSADEEVTIVQAILEFDKDHPTMAKDILGEAQQRVDTWKLSHPEVEFYLGGSVVSNVTLEQAVKDDLQQLVPLSYLIITLGLLLFLRSIKATVITLIIVTLSIIFTFSLFALFKQELTPVAGFVPSVVLTLAVADCVHYLTSYRYLMMYENHTCESANKEAFSINIKPISITSLTTAVGVLFLNFSDSPPYADLGNMVAIGVTLAWVFSITMLPLILSKFPIVYQKKQRQADEPLILFSRWVRRFRGLITMAAFALLLFGGWGLTQLKISENWSKYFSEEFELSQTVSLLKEKFGRLHRYELVIETGESGEVNALAYLSTLDRLLAYLEQHSSVKHIQSYGYVLKRLNQNMHNDQTDYFKMPDSRELAAQYLLLYELSLPQGLGINTYINSDRSAARTSIALEPMDSEQLIQFENELRRAFAGFNKNPDYQLNISGMDHIFAHIAHRNILQMIIGSGVALLIISVLIGFVLRSLRYGAISLIPNLIPGFVAYGIWGFVSGYIDLALSVVICMSLGIIVDDTVHFLTKYSRARHHLRLSSEKSLDYAFHIVGKALITTTVILVAGFATITISPLTPTANTGLLLCITLLVALVIDFTLLPLALYWMDKKRQIIRSAAYKP